MKKALRRTVIVLIVLVAVILIVATTALNSIVRTAVITIGPKLTKTEVKLAKVKISIFSGHGELQGLEIGNPEGFEAPSAIKVGDLQIVLKPSSLLSKVIIIDSILIDGPEITYEMGLGDSNLGRLSKNLAGKPPAGKEAAKAAPPGEAKQVVISDLTIRNGKIKLSAKGMMGASGAVALPTIHLTDIGKESGGASMAEAVSQVLGAIMKGSGTVAKDAGKLLGAGAKELRSGATLTTKMAGDAGKAVGEVGVETAEAAGEAVKSLGGAARKGLSGIARGVEGLLVSTNAASNVRGK